MWLLHPTQAEGVLCQTAAQRRTLSAVKALISGAFLRVKRVRANYLTSFVSESKSTKTQILQNRPDIETDRQGAVISYITDNITVTSKEISELLGISHKKSKQLLHKLMAKDFVIIKNGKYTLKA